jgi:ADP-glucose pyrophosphorylase
MKNIIIMAAGASSRMKKTLDEVDLSTKVKEVASLEHKTLIPLDGKGKSLLFYLCSNVKQAGYENVYILTSLENKAFHQWIDFNKSDPEIKGLKFFLSIQNIPQGRQKPMGTADGIQQALDQFPELLKQRFTVCNADNLYSINVLKSLLHHDTSPHSIIAYDRSYLKFPEERITKFALIKLDDKNFLKEIVEKPPIETHNSYRNSSNQLLVSMNIFSFSGLEIYPYLKDCIMNHERNEKELPEALRTLIKHEEKSVLAYIAKEHLKDLTSAHDIEKF